MLLPADPANAFVPYPDVEVPNAATGPLSGLTFAAKDLFDVTGYPTGGGNPLILAKSGIKTKNAVTVQKLLDAGARFVGKAHTDELAFSMNGKNAHFGTPINGGAPDRIPGGSSSGSASAVSNKLCDFALGTDTGGSVRAPANHCGLFGIRPTHGRISLEGALDLAPSYDTCGFFARDAATFARVADVLLGADASPVPEKVRLLWPTDVWAMLDQPVRDALAPASEKIQTALGRATKCTVALESFDAMYWNFRYIQGYESWQTDGPFITQHAVPLGPGVAERFAWSKNVTRAQYDEACAFRRRFTAHLEQLLGGDSVLLMPTMPDIAPLLTAEESELQRYRDAAIQMLCIAGLSGFPQISLPTASRLGAPLGISLLGPAGSDRALVSIAERVIG
ncbi:MAG: amidase [Burkholderiales bacterium]|nr:MAG: amidase [Betaproteobacteria bacterium]TAG78626.1 MAG: amidase [Burkholderiales bacterium]